MSKTSQTVQIPSDRLASEGTYGLPRGYALSSLDCYSSFIILRRVITVISNIDRAIPWFFVPSRRNLARFSVTTFVKPAVFFI